MSFQKEHIDCFVVCSGDSDFSPLVSKLKENNKYVIGLGVKNSTSDLLIENCDEFIFYEDLVRGQQRQMPAMGSLPEKIQEAFQLLVDSVLALQRENKEVLWGSMVKETMKRKKPSFNETYYGFRTFSHLLEEAQRKGIVVLRRDAKSGSYIVEDLGTGAGTPAARVETARRTRWRSCPPPRRRPCPGRHRDRIRGAGRERRPWAAAAPQPWTAPARILRHRLERRGDAGHAPARSTARTGTITTTTITKRWTTTRPRPTEGRNGAGRPQSASEPARPPRPTPGSGAELARPVRGARALRARAALLAVLLDPRVTAGARLRPPISPRKTGRTDRGGGGRP